jgi:hypothetical protein
VLETEHAIASHAYLRAFEKNVEVEPMEIAKWLIWALGLERGRAGGSRRGTAVTMRLN